MAKPAKPTPAASPIRPPEPSVRNLKRGHGASIRGLDAVARTQLGFGRFGRMFPELPPARYGATLQDDMLVMQAVAATMIRIDPGAPITVAEPADESPTIPAGYTYFGQFIDHDLTLDVASSLDRETDPEAVQDFRTPRLDLDSVYGRGPDEQPYLFNPDLTMRLGPNRALDPKRHVRPDVLRVPPEAAADSTSLTGDRDCARALIGDKRNDENLIVLQMHALFVRLHNAFMRIERDAWLRTKPGQPVAFEQIFSNAQRRTRWTYQYLVVHDFVRRVVGQAMFDRVWNGGKVVLEVYDPGNAAYPYMPIEFSVAAFRLGHSMVRPSYALNERAGGGHARLPVFGDPSGPDGCTQRNNLNGFRPLPDHWGIDWSYFFGKLRARHPKGARVVPQPSYRLDTLLVDPLMNLPDKPGERGDVRRSLPARNLMRGAALGLPSGQLVARRMGLIPLSDHELWSVAGNLPGPDDEANPDLRRRRASLPATFDSLKGNAPLWYYILREAELANLAEVDGRMLGGACLGEVGGRIVAEVLIGLLLKDEQSYLNRHPRWRPAGLDGKPTAAFTMETLAAFLDAPPKSADEVS